jgi:hypothetical protein
MSRRTVRQITIWLILGLVILSCGTPALVTSPPPAAAPGSVETIIVRTAAAAQTQTLTVVPPSDTPTLTPSATRTPTISPTPTATFLFVIPKGTGLAGTLSTDEAGNGTDTGNGNNDNQQNGFVKPTATPSEWACRVLSKSPANNSVLVGGTTFKAVWTVQNTGTKTWPKKGVDVVFGSGAHIHQGKPYYDIPAGVGPGGTVTISITMSVPKYPKDYSSRWSLKVGKTEFCGVRFIFSVK